MRQRIRRRIFVAILAVCGTNNTCHFVSGGLRCRPISQSLLRWASDHPVDLFAWGDYKRDACLNFTYESAPLTDEEKACGRPLKLRRINSVSTYCCTKLDLSKYRDDDEIRD